MHEDSHRLKTPMKLVGGKWQRLSWEQAINEVGDKLLAIRQESGPDAVYWVGSSKHSNEGSYLMRKFVSFFGTNNCDHQARICHSTTVVRRRQHLGLRRDDQFVQRHAEHQVRAVHRQQRRRSAPRVDGAHAARQGNRREDDRRRSALHAHRRARRLLRAPALGHRHRVPVRRAVPHLQERLGRQEVHPRPRLRHGQGARRGAGEVDAGQGRGSDRRARGAGLQGRRDDGEEPAVDAGLVHGPDAAHDRQRHGARVVHRAARAGQHRRVGRRRQHLPRPRQRAGRHRHRPQSRLAAGLLRRRHRRVEALRRGVGRAVRLDPEALRVAGDDGKARASRCRAGSTASPRRTS